MTIHDDYRTFYWVFPNIFKYPDFIAYVLLMDMWLSIIAATFLYPHYIFLSFILITNSVLTVGLYTAVMINSILEVRL